MSSFNLYTLHFVDGFVNAVSHTWPDLRPFKYFAMLWRDYRYISCLESRKKMVQFASYRRLSVMMDTKFHTCTTEEELEDVGRVCIICRDTLLLSKHRKKLPGCSHAFHKYCLKGWLMQQNIYVCYIITAPL